MKVTTPLGDYDYRIERVALRDRHLEVKGRMGEWETTMVLDGSDLVEAGKRVGPVLALIGAIAVVTRRRRRV